MTNTMNNQWFTVIADSANREDWLNKRQLTVGASESAALLQDADGNPISKWNSPLSLAVAKKTPVTDTEMGEIQESGLWLEPHIAERFLEEVERKGMPCGLLLRSKQYPWMSCTPDWWVVDYPVDDHLKPNMDVPPHDVPLQIKNSMMASEWNEGIPQEIYIQVQHELVVTGAPWGYVAVLLTGNRFRWRLVPADSDLQDEIIGASKEFMEKLEQNLPIESDGHRATGPALAKLFPTETGLTVPLSGELLRVAQDLDEVIASGKVIDAAKAQLTNALKLALGPNTFGSFVDGSGVSLKSQTRRAKDCAECGHEVSAATTFRVLRRQMAKSQ